VQDRVRDAAGGARGLRRSQDKALAALDDSAHLVLLLGANAAVGASLHCACRPEAPVCPPVQQIPHHKSAHEWRYDRTGARTSCLVGLAQSAPTDKARTMTG